MTYVNNTMNERIAARLDGYALGYLKLLFVLPQLGIKRYALPQVATDRYVRAVNKINLQKKAIFQLSARLL
jgi:hypothetical protein